MLAKIWSAHVEGIEGISVNVEVDLCRGLPNFQVVGLGDAAVKEACQRVKSAIINSGFPFPNQKIVVNLVPAYLHKRGSQFDLAIAIGILAASGIIKKENVLNSGFIGELGLDGSILHVKGALPMAKAFGKTGRNHNKLDSKAEKESEMPRLFLPAGNLWEGELAREAYPIHVEAVGSLRRVVECLNSWDKGKEWSNSKNKDLQSKPWKRTRYEAMDFADVKGQWAAKEAIALAVCGNHSMMMMGPPGSGKTMLARRIPTILPDMDPWERLETAIVYSAAGACDDVDLEQLTGRPFRMVNSSITKAGLLGGGNVPYPGEISLAHNGILFIDEFLELEKARIEALREPMENREINMTRRGRLYTFPASFLLITAANPCKCGYFGDRHHICTCTQTQIERYRSRLSGPIADRIDLFINEEPVLFDTLREDALGTSALMRENVMKGRQRQKERFEGCPISFNGQMDERQIEEYCRLGTEEERFLGQIYETCKLSTRRYFKLLRLARTIADMAGSNRITMEHLGGALGYTLREGESQ